MGWPWPLPVVIFGPLLIIIILILQEELTGGPQEEMYGPDVQFKCERHADVGMSAGNLRKHVVDSQSVSFDGALKVAKELRGHGLSRADASRRMLDSRAKTLSELVSVQPDGAFAFVLDTVRGRPWLWRKPRAKAPPTKM